MPNALLASLRAAFSLVDELPYCDGSLGKVFENEPSFAKLLYRVEEQAAFIDFANTPTEEALKSLADACHKATFGLNDKDVLDEAYRKAGKMDTTEFATLLSPNALGLINVIATNLLRGRKSADDIEAKLYKLNVYGPGSFFKPHVDTPRGDDMFGTLVLVLPTKHEGGALAFRHSGQEWAFDSAKALSDDEKSIAYVAFIGDMQHEVLPVVSGYRVTLTYNLHYREHSAASVPANVVSLCDYPGLAEMRQSLSKLLADPNFLPAGGVIGFGLSHRYPFDIKTKLTQIYKNLRGPDALVSDICKELQIDVALKTLYHNDDEPDFCLLNTFVSKWNISASLDDPELVEQLIYKYDVIYCRDLENKRTEYAQYEEGNNNFTEMVWIKPLNKSNAVEDIGAVYGNESTWCTLYGEVCLVARVAPAAERVPGSGSGERPRSGSDAATDNLAKKFKATENLDSDSTSDPESDPSDDGESED